jgi:uncharacterized protein (DUF1684 family)
VPPVSGAREYLELADWRRRVAVMWADWRRASAGDAAAATEAFRRAKDELFREHPQSPLLPDRRPGFEGLSYWPYDPAYRMRVRLEPVPVVEPAPESSMPFPAAGFAPIAIATAPTSASSGAFGGPIDLPSSGSGGIPFKRIGRVPLAGPLEGSSLDVFWIDAYGGGLFLPFRDGTSGTETYGAGRYLLDTIKSADHGGDYRTGELLLDFNMAFHPSCAYDPKWSCPLAPPENRLTVPIRVGERLG